MAEGKLYRLRFLTAVLLPAAVLMALEIVSSRLLAPAFGNSVYVWGSIIGVFLAAMSSGYVLGGHLADRSPRLAALGRLLLLAALLQWGTALVGRHVVALVGAATGGRPAGTLLAAAVLFGPATLLLATVSPFAVRLAARDPAQLGGVSGRLFALSTAGSLIGTLAATFVLITYLSLDAILALLVSATALAAAATFERARSRALALAVGALCWAVSLPRPDAVALLAERITPYQTLVVRESEGRRYLYSDGTLHGASVVASGEPVLAYIAASRTLALYQPRPRRVLVLGLGAGGLGRVARQLPSVGEVTYVDIDPAVAEIAARWFGVAADGRQHVVVADARRFLSASAADWDWIYSDTYVGHSVPFHLATREFFELARARLAPGGVLGVNLIGSLHNPFPRAIYRTLASAFDRVDAFGVPASANFLLVAHAGPALSPSSLAERAAALDGLGLPGGFARLARARTEIDFDLTSVPLLHDGYAPVDALLDLTAREMPR